MRLANHSEPFEGLARNKGFQPQNKPPVHTGGFDLLPKVLKLVRSLYLCKEGEERIVRSEEHVI